MSKRLQVVVQDSEYAKIVSLAEANGMTVSEWIRQIIRKVERDNSYGDIEKKLSALKSAVQYSFPSGKIDGILSEIEHGYIQSYGSS